MRIEPNVHVERLSPQIILGLVILNECVQECTSAELTLTSGGDGVHSCDESKHYPDPETGLVHAADTRIKDFDGNILDISGKDMSLAKEVVKKAKDKLGPQFDVVLEGNHIHIEYDPKNRNHFVKGKYV